jgi:hypothetical protein
VAWNAEVAAMGNSTLLTVLDKLNMSTIHLRKLIAALVIITVNVTFVIGVATEVVGTATVIVWRVPIAAVVWRVPIALFMPSDYE